MSVFYAPGAVWLAQMLGNMTSVPPGPPPGDDTVLAMGKQLTNIMTVQLFGYLLKRSGAITPVTEAGIGHFVGNFAFPCVLFHAITGLTSNEIGPAVPLMLAIAISKAVIFAIAFALGALSVKKGSGAGRGLERGALFAIFCTQSDDVALGVPIIGALLPDHTCPLYVLSAMQALLFNPLAYVMLGLSKARAEAARDGPDATPRSVAAIAGRVLWGLRRNVLVMSVILGLMWRAVSAAAGVNGLPWFVDYPVALLATPFTPLVYLIGGFAFAGSTSALKALPTAVHPIACVALKSICLPIVALGAITWFTDPPSSTQKSFIYLYALLPCANSALVIARLFGHASGPLFATLASALALNKMVAFLLLFFAGVLSSPLLSVATLLAVKSMFSEVCLWMSYAGCQWLGFCALVTPAWVRCRGMRILLLHFTLQYLFAIIFVSFQITDHPQDRPTDEENFRAQYAIVNTLRWMINGSLLLITLDWARCARAVAASVDTGRKPPLGMSFSVHLLGSFAFGLAFTLPFVCGAVGELAPRPFDTGTDFWLVYGKPQTLIYCIAYALLCACKMVCVVIVITSKRRIHAAETLMMSFLVFS